MKYLSEKMKEVEREFGDQTEQNTIIISPTGSGKTHYIFNELSRGHSCLYLCDNSNLREQVLLNDRTYNKDNLLYGFDDYQVEVMTYKAFGRKIRFNNDLIERYDRIFCDEVHSLVEYQKFNDDVDLSHTIKEIFKKYEKTKIYYFTATQYYLIKLKEQFGAKDIDRFVKSFNFMKCKDIKRYINISKYYINNIEQLSFHLKAREEQFEYRNAKGLFFTRHIKDMKKMEDILIKNGLNPICIWSQNNEKNLMDKNQLAVRKHLIETGKLMDPFNFLIINKSSETGINITDENMKICVVNSTNLTEQIQSRGRLRHDIDLFILRTNEQKLPNVKIKLDKKWLDRYLTTEDKNELCKELAIPNKKGKLSTWRSIKPLLIKNGYKIKDTVIQRENKRKNASIIQGVDIS